jgi:hypothetical protein
MQIFISYGLQSEPICLGLLEVLSLLNLSSSNLKECLLKINLLKVQKINMSHIFLLLIDYITIANNQN